MHERECLCRAVRERGEQAILAATRGLEPVLCGVLEGIDLGGIGRAGLVSACRVLVTGAEKPAERARDPRVRVGRLALVAQLGLGFVANVFDCIPACRLAPQADGALVLDLPEGDYIVVLRKAGMQELRYPVSVPSDQGERRVCFVEKSAVPDGFVYIPAGSFAEGVDEGAYEPFERGRREVGAFLMRKYEVTFEEYLAFLNDRAVYERIDARGAQAGRGFQAVSARTRSRAPWTRRPSSR